MWLAALEAAAAPAGRTSTRRTVMSIFVLVLLLVLLIGVVPTWPYSRGWGYFPGGIVGILLIIAIVMFATGRI
jgi:hypothetical protein